MPAPTVSRRADLQTYSVFDFRKGLDLHTSALTLAVQRGQNALRKADNAVYQSAGAVSKRLDSTTLTTSSVGASVAITGGVEYVKSDGTREVYFGTDDGRIVKLNSDGTTTNQVTGLTSGTRWYFATYNDILIACNQADAPRKLDGGVWGTLGGSPPSTGGPVAVHGNRVFFLQANSSLLTWSALNNEEDYTTANNAGSVLVSDNDGSKAIGLVPSINELIILKGNRPYRLQGTSPSTFALTNLVPTTGSVGAVSPQACFFAANDVWYLAANGIVNLRTVLDFGDLRASFASERISTYFERGTDFTLSLQNLDDAVAAYDSQANRLFFAVDNSSDGENDTVLVYDLHTEGWSVWDFAMASLWPVRDSSTGIVELYAGGYDGHIRALNRDVSTNAIDFHVQHLSALNAPGIEKSPRYAYLYLKEEGNHSVSVTVNYDFGATGGQTFAASLLGGSKTLGVNWTLGVDPLGARQQIVKRLDLSGTGEFVQISVRNQEAGQPVTWYGYEIMWRPRRQVRRGTAAV
jgi:hypothetical protein